MTLLGGGMLSGLRPKRSGGGGDRRSGRAHAMGKRPLWYFTAQGGLHDGSVAHGEPMLDEWGSHAVAGMIRRGMIRLRARARGRAHVRLP